MLRGDYKLSSLFFLLVIDIFDSISCYCVEIVKARSIKSCKSSYACSSMQSIYSIRSSLLSPYTTMIITYSSKFKISSSSVNLLIRMLSWRNIIVPCVFTKNHSSIYCITSAVLNSSLNAIGSILCNNKFRIVCSWLILVMRF